MCLCAVSFAVHQTSISQIFFAHGPLLALKNNHGSAHPLLHKYSVRVTGTQN